MITRLFIPEKIKVGFQKRDGTYTGKLAYIIYYDEKGVLRKEGSWQNWRDKSIKDIEVENKPQDGFIFNKNIQRTSYHFGSGRSVMRVYDPRNFEFEIDMDNLSCILMNADVSKSEINEKCVFGWSGKDLVLIPVSSHEYKEAIAYTALQKTSVTTKDLVKGLTYKKKKDNDNYVYMGYFEWFKEDYIAINMPTTNIYNSSRYRVIMKSQGKKHIFFNKVKKFNEFMPLSASVLSECLTVEVDDDYADLLIRLENELNINREKALKDA